LYVKVYSLLRDWIIGGRLLPGEPVRETVLAAELGVSRTPVRDALRRLEQDRLIVPVQGQAYEVYRPSEQDLAYLYGARAVLEGGAAAAAAERVTDSAVEALEGILEHMQQAYDRQEIGQVIGLDMQFHDTLVAASGNPVLVELHAHLSTRLSHVRSLSGGIAGRRGQVLEQHRAIVEGLCSRSGPAAEAAVRAHIQSVYQGVRERFTASGNRERA
jgi:DNA-binding GntR family transcriptional regulator